MSKQKEEVKQLPKWIPKKYHHMVEDVSDERGLGEGVWIYLKREWYNVASGGSAIHEDTKSIALEELRYNVIPMTEDQLDDPYYGPTRAEIAAEKKKQNKRGKK